jgi:hypothetical protein
VILTTLLARPTRCAAPPFLDHVDQDVVQGASLVERVVTEPVVKVWWETQAEELVLGRLSGAPTALRQILGLHAARSVYPPSRYRDFLLSFTRSPVENPELSGRGANLWSHE